MFHASLRICSSFLSTLPCPWRLRWVNGVHGASSPSGARRHEPTVDTSRKQEGGRKEPQGAHCSRALPGGMGGRWCGRFLYGRPQQPPLRLQSSLGSQITSSPRLVKLPLSSYSLQSQTHQVTLSCRLSYWDSRYSKIEGEDSFASLPRLPLRLRPSADEEPER